MLKGKKINIYLWGELETRTTKLARALGSAGVDVAVISLVQEIPQEQNCDIHVEYMQVPQTGQSLNQKRIIRVLSNVLYHWVSNRKILRKRQTFCQDEMRRHLIRTRPDLAIAVNAFTLKGVAEGAAKIGIPFAYETYEFWPDHAFDESRGFTDQQRKFLASVETTYAPKASLLVTVSGFLAREYKKTLGLNSLPRVIFNAPLNIAEHTTPAHRPMRLVFVGNIVPERNIELVVDALKNVKGIEFFIQGDGYHKQNLKKYVANNGLQDSIHFVDPVPYGSLCMSLAKYDVGVISYEVYNRHVDGALPNKFFEYMAGGLAILLSETAAFREFANIDAFALFFNPRDVKSVTSCLEQLKDNAECMEEMKKRALQEAKRYCGKQLSASIIGNYQRLFE